MLYYRPAILSTEAKVWREKTPEVHKTSPGSDTSGTCFAQAGNSLNTCRPRGIGVNIGEKVEKSRVIKSNPQLFLDCLYDSLRILTAKNGEFYRKLHVGLKTITDWKLRGQMLPARYRN